MSKKPYIFEPELEAMPRELLRERQTNLLKKLTETCYNNMEMYRDKFNELLTIQGECYTYIRCPSLVLTSNWGSVGLYTVIHVDRCTPLQHVYW